MQSYKREEWGFYQAQVSFSSQPLKAVLSRGAKWNSAWDQNENLIVSPLQWVSLQRIISFIMWERSRNCSLDRQLLDLSIGEAAGEWEVGVNASAKWSSLLEKAQYSVRDFMLLCVHVRKSALNLNHQEPTKLLYIYFSSTNSDDQELIVFVAGKQWED